MPRAEEGLRRLTLGDPGFVAMITRAEGPASDIAHLDARTDALVKIAALIALDAPPSSYRTAVEAALRAGAELDDLLAVLAAVGGTVGSARLVSGAPRIALAAGYDVEAELERLDHVDPSTDGLPTQGG
jgi:alkylhydroperoxidase/carboxymuconolactone decarboxylase family protein YurZ